MIVLWIAAALMSAACAGLIISRAAAARAVAGGAFEDPALAVYRRQLVEVDDLAERGLIAPDEVRSAHAEAARRLLSAADSVRAAWGAAPGGGRIVLAVAALAPLAALGFYLRIGSPNDPDQPYAKRVAAWSQGDPAALDAAQMAAVLQSIIAKRPGQVEPLIYLAHAQADTGDLFSAEQTLDRALKLAPNRPDLWGYDGELLAEDGGADLLTDDARAALGKALALAPKAAEPRYLLGRDRIAAGDVDGGLAMWRGLEDDLSPQAPQRPILAQEIAIVAQTRALPAPESQTPGGDQQAFIRQMVAALAARLASRPDDPAGWARLVRSYGVLGDAPRRAAALAQARVLFKDRPKDLALVEAEASVRP